MVAQRSEAERREAKLQETVAELGTKTTVIERAPFKVHLLHPAGYSHFATLRGKLNWHELPVLSRPAA